MNRTIFRAISLLFVVLALRGNAACSSGEPDLGEKLEQVCAQASKLVCVKFAECGPHRFPAVYASSADCERVENDWCRRKLAAPDIAQTPEAELACTQVASTLSCADWYGTVPDACLTPEGPRAEGDPCLWDAQCSTRACVPGPELVCGVCVRRRALGEECDDTRPCEERLACTHTDDAPGVCVAEAKPGEACVDRPCSLAYQAFCINGMCVPMPQLGENCEALYCGWWLYCDAVSLTCVPDRIAGLGESCAPSAAVDGEAPQCGPGLYCGSGTLTCFQRGLPADDCAVGTCAVGHTCILGLCGNYDDNVCRPGAPLDTDEQFGNSWRGPSHEQRAESAC